jgi:hypothetical protein
MKKQTAVEWLIEQLECFGNKHELQLSWATVDELVEQAKAMERDQIVEAYWEGACNWDNEKTAEQFYNETYGGDK